MASFFDEWNFVAKPVELRAKPSAKDWRIVFLLNIQKQLDLLTGERQPSNKRSPKGQKFAERAWYGVSNGKYYASLKLSNKFISNGERDSAPFDSKDEVIDFYKSTMERTRNQEKELEKVLISHRQKVHADRGVIKIKKAA